MQTKTCLARKSGRAFFCAQKPIGNGVLVRDGIAFRFSQD
jgi:hypothetical protein